jgi:hypothetical protein
MCLPCHKRKSHEDLRQFHGSRPSGGTKNGPEAPSRKPI